MNVEQKVMMLKELRKQHKYLKSIPDKEHNDSTLTLIVLIEEKIEQILERL